MHYIDEATLRRLYLDEQMTIEQIARRLRVRTKTVCDRLKECNLQRPSPIDPQTARQLYDEERLTISEIAERQRVSYRAVRVALIEAGVSLRKQGPRRDRPAPAPEVGAAIKGYVADHGIRRTARWFKISPHKVYALTGELPKWRGTQRRLDDAAVRRAYEQGMKVAQLAEQWNCHPRTIQRSLERTSRGSIPSQRKEKSG